MTLVRTSRATGHPSPPPPPPRPTSLPARTKRLLPRRTLSCRTEVPSRSGARQTGTPRQAVLCLGHLQGPSIDHQTGVTVSSLECWVRLLVAIQGLGSLPRSLTGCTGGPSRDHKKEAKDFPKIFLVRWN